MPTTTTTAYTEEQQTAIEQLKQEKTVLAVKAANGAILAVYRSKSYFVRITIDRAGKCRLKQYYRYFNEDSLQPFELINTQIF